MISSAQAGQRIAKECKRSPCKQAIARCVRDACAGFHGIVKHGCVRAGRSAINGACTVSGDYARFCSELSSGESCAPD
jgi:hypothetical protein